MSSVSPRAEGDEPEAVLRLELERNEEAPSVARAAIAGFCQDRDIPADAVSTLRLLVSEVVTNAVVHPDAAATANIELLVRMTAGVIRVEVTDQGSGFTPSPRNPAQVGGGFGLYLLEKEASGWGVVQRGGTMVWLEVRTS
jgi:anti-sigma regulatory factor (Ser/Thr protein kinase)